MQTKSKDRLAKLTSLITAIDAKLPYAFPGEVLDTSAFNMDIIVQKTLTGVIVYVLTEDGKREQAHGLTLEAAFKRSIQAEDAQLLISEKGRVYRTKTGIALRVWHKDVDRLQVLIDVYGGNYYRHQSGFVWVCARRATLRLISEEVGHMEELDELLHQLER